MSPDEPAELELLKKASEGLEYPSESDEPFEPFHWAAKPGESIEALVAAHARPGRKVEEVPIDQFFSPLEESDDADRYRQLQACVRSRLKGARVFRVGAGEVEVDIYLVGQIASGDWVGLHTRSVET